MSNKLNLPSINPWSNVEVKGTLDVTGLITAAGGINISAPLTLPSGSGLKYQQIDAFISSIVSATAVTVYVPVKIAGTIDSITVGCSATPVVGPATFTCSIVHAGVTTAITNGTPSVATTDVAGTPITVTPTGANAVVAGDLIKIIVGGSNTQAGNGCLGFRVLVA
jgi:hypothetical protein